jgi:hypothetical protein
MEDGDIDESDEATDKIISEMDVQKAGGNNGGMIQSNDQNKVSRLDCSKIFRGSMIWKPS